MKQGNKSFAEGLGFGCAVYAVGVLLHLALAFGYRNLAFEKGAAPSAASNPWVISLLGALGGAFFVFFTGRLVWSLSVAPKAPSARALLVRGGLYGVATTVASIETLYVLIALYLAAWPVGAMDSAWTAAISLLITTQAFGMEFLLFSLTISFVYGAVLGFVLWSRRDWIPIMPEGYDRTRATANASAVLGIVGLFFFFLPIPGWILSGLAFAFGLRSVRQSRLESRVLPTSGRVGLALGLVGLVAGVAVFAAAFVLL